MSDLTSRRPPSPPPHADAAPGGASDLHARLVAEARGRGDARRPSVPVEVLLREASEVADFIDRRWEPSRDESGRPLPGLAGGAALFPRAVADELRALVTLAGDAQREAARVRRASSEAATERARALVREFDAAAAWLVVACGVTGLRKPLARARTARRAWGTSAEAVADALDAAAALVAPHVGALEGVGGFRAEALVEAAAAADALRERAAERAAVLGEALGGAYVAMLNERVARARAAARFVFRAHPEVAREATSAWERAKWRRRKKA